MKKKSEDGGGAVWVICNDELYIRGGCCGIHPLIWGTDGLTMCSWDDEKQIYLKAKECLDWFKRELEAGEREGYRTKELNNYRESIAVLEKALIDKEED